MFHVHYPIIILLIAVNKSPSGSRITMIRRYIVLGLVTLISSSIDGASDASLWRISQGITLFFSDTTLNFFFSFFSFFNSEVSMTFMAPESSIIYWVGIIG